MDAPPGQHVHGSPSGGVEERARTDATYKHAVSLLVRRKQRAVLRDPKLKCEPETEENTAPTGGWSLSGALSPPDISHDHTRARQRGNS